MQEISQGWSATGRTRVARTVGNFSLSVTGTSSPGTISLLKVVARLAAPAFPDSGIPRFDDRLQPVPLFRSCAPIQICLCSTPKSVISLPGDQELAFPIKASAGCYTLKHLRTNYRKLVRRRV